MKHKRKLETNYESETKRIKTEMNELCDLFSKLIKQPNQEPTKMSEMMDKIIKNIKNITYFNCLLRHRINDHSINSLKIIIMEDIISMLNKLFLEIDTYIFDRIKLIQTRSYDDNLSKKINDMCKVVKLYASQDINYQIQLYVLNKYHKQESDLLKLCNFDKTTNDLIGKKRKFDTMLLITDKINEDYKCRATIIRNIIVNFWIECKYEICNIINERLIKYEDDINLEIRNLSI